MNRPHKISPTVCKCGIPWESPCRCPEDVLERFTHEHGGSVFYFTDLNNWVFLEFSTYDNDIIQSVLNIDGVIELGDSAYQSPYEVDVC